MEGYVPLATIFSSRRQGKTTRRSGADKRPTDQREAHKARKVPSIQAQSEESGRIVVLASAVALDNVVRTARQLLEKHDAICIITPFGENVIASETDLLKCIGRMIWAVNSRFTIAAMV